MLIIGGPTASGKSKLAIMLAKIADGEIVSADSMQIYKHMDIGTAKVTEAEKQNIPHYMIDFIEPYQEYSVAQYREDALKIIEDINSRGKLPIIEGGTGLYINALIYPLSFGKTYKDEALRKDLKEKAIKYGNDYVHDKLKSVDENAARVIHKNNLKRVIRAIEIKLLSGKSILDAKDEAQASFYRMYAVDYERRALYAKINARVEKMFESGLVEEVDSLINKHGLNFEMQSMQAIGYKEFKKFYEKELTLEQTKELIKKNTRNYAKRQLTWFKRYEHCVWLNEENINESFCQKIIEDYYENTVN